MQETKILEDQIAGLKAKILALRKDKESFIKAQGVATEAEKLRGEGEKLRAEVTLLKDSNAILITKKNSMVAASLSGMLAKMKEILPEGAPIITVQEEGDIFIGWQKEGKLPVSYSGLSGGERVMFDAALCHALKANIIISEFAELDEQRLPLALEKFKKMDVQVIVSSCHSPKEIPKEWSVIELK